MFANLRLSCRAYGGQRGFGFFKAAVTSGTNSSQGPAGPRAHRGAGRKAAPFLALHSRLRSDRERLRLLYKAAERTVPAPATSRPARKRLQPRLPVPEQRRQPTRPRWRCAMTGSVRPRGRYDPEKALRVAMTPGTTMRRPCRKPRQAFSATISAVTLGRILKSRARPAPARARNLVATGPGATQVIVMPVPRTSSDSASENARTK